MSHSNLQASTYREPNSQFPFSHLAFIPLKVHCTSVMDGIVYVNEIEICNGCQVTTGKS